MKILPKYKVRCVADENVVMVQGANPGDMTTVIALNETSLYLWNSLSNRDFEKSDAVNLLTERYDVGETQALADVEAWIAILKEHGIIV